MHESSLARRILEAVLARSGAARRVRVVRGWVAETETLSADSLDFHFRAHAAGTAAADARLELRLEHVEARCGGCGARYRPEHHLLLCPSCGATGGELLGRTGLGIDSIDVEEP
jgi:hydrogenase nickel incorporation protein HypA/HybF